MILAPWRVVGRRQLSLTDALASTRTRIRRWSRLFRTSRRYSVRFCGRSSSRFRLRRLSGTLWGRSKMPTAALVRSASLVVRTSGHLSSENRDT